MTHRLHLAMVSVGLAFVCGASLVLAADQIVVDRQNACQMSVPADWKIDALIKSSASSPDKMETAIVSSTNRGQSLNDAKAMMQAIYKPIKVLEDSAQRLWYEYVPMNNQNGKARAWYVGIPVNGNVCGAQITMKDGNEAVAKSIAMSLKAK